MRTTFARDSECQQSFDTFNKALCHAPDIAPPDHEARYCLHVDPSQYALGAVLSQVHDKAEKVLEYFSCKLHIAEMQYPACDRELLGIRDAMFYWKFNLKRAEQ